MPETLIQAVREGKLEYSKARALASIKDEEVRADLLQLTLTENLSLKQIKEALGKRNIQETSIHQRKAQRIDIADLKRKLTPGRIEKLPAVKLLES
jgi:ParB family chromosome partitioning protein